MHPKKIRTLIDGWALNVGLAHDATEKMIATELLTHDERTGWVLGNAMDVTTLAASLFHRPPPATGALTPLEAMTLASACYRHELAPGAVEDTSDVDALSIHVHRKLVRCIRDGDGVSLADAERRTAFQSVRDLGGAFHLGLPVWVYDALSDDESGWYLGDDHYRRVALACANRSPGRRWTHVTGLGYITWKLRIL